MENNDINYHLKKGRILLKTIPVVFFILCLGVSIWVMTLQLLEPYWILLIGFLTGIFFSWLWWSLNVARWKIQAFGSTRNVHELKQKALRESLIYPEEHWGTRTEFWTSAQKDEWSFILLKFNQSDLPTINASIPDETRIYFSKRTNQLQAIGGIALLLLGLWMLIENNWVIALLLILTGIYSAYNNWKEATNTQAQLILSSKGIELSDGTFFQWNEISNEQAFIESQGKSSQQILLFNSIDTMLEQDTNEEYSFEEEHRIELDDLTHTAEQVDHILRVYRSRYKLNQ